MKFKKIIPPFFIIFITFVLLDYFWVTFLSGNFHFGRMRPIANMYIVGESVFIRYWAAAAAYGLLALGMTYLVKPHKLELKESAVSGALYGLVAFGFYNFTNNATLEYWPLDLLSPDVVWGTFSACLTSVLVQKFCRA